ncbi:hypothetical protein POSPLADRAFT_1170489 [Postia placenta MAD-698-R-SB12]|uniref:Multifunctional tryptophan biosynthesis protein n=1 Tax=Postia placenta MAD-698-R-SB12 TaxID=670580 RepID=A0A1X6N085_9APHY|nr:hypothetical protein POSPLADRAFT_1170489 [Postia placenta MAD-698-R-SB12]OSX61900.1 hypothetical protein POSPLADRAFT_1170489 [Postia placenta MAD-698-R-SB12]
MSLPAELDRPLDVLLIDNFDSFTWNLYQSLCLLGADVTVIRNDAITPDALPSLQIRSLIISPGPGHPSTDSGISRDAIRFFTGKVPVLGVCMGLECLVDVFGGQIAYAGEIMHGKVSQIRHDGRGVFAGLPQLINTSSLPPTLAVTATTQESGVIMGVRHREYTMEAVQYHPESILSEGGDALLRNFLRLRGGSWAENSAFGVTSASAAAAAVGAGAASAKVPTILEKIYAQRMRDVEAAKLVPGTTAADLQTLLDLSLAPPLTSFVDALTAGPGAPALMAEIKRASPSKGAIALGTNAAQQALTYALAGARVISVLTEPTWFKGTLADMRAAREAVDALPRRPAILRKDFIFDEYQVLEARVHGADTVLLIVAMLAPARLGALHAYARGLGMEPLVEVNNAAEMEAALALGARVVGVNNRNLHDFAVDMGTTSRLAEMVRARGVVLCALSGITGPADVRTYVAQGVGAVLVGEALMRAPDTRAFIRELLDWPAQEEENTKTPPPALVKICGIRTEDEALQAMDAGADMLGLMFVPRSRRHISLAQAQKISMAVHASRFARPVREPAAAEEGAEAELGTRPWFAAHAHALGAPDSHARPLLVGVFQDQPLAAVLRAVEVAQLDMVQLHGREPAEWARHVPVPVVRVFHVGADASVDDAALRDLTRPGLNQYVLLDAVRPGNKDGLSGGAGVAVDWGLARAVVERGEVPGVAAGAHPMPIILAGGLTPENVREAVEAVRPWAVDVSGGVETADGSGKDARKVRAFVEAVKGDRQT